MLETAKTHFLLTLNTREKQAKRLIENQCALWIRQQKLRQFPWTPTSEYWTQSRSRSSRVCLRVLKGLTGRTSSFVSLRATSSHSHAKAKYMSCCCTGNLWSLFQQVAKLAPSPFADLGSVSFLNR